MGDKIKVCIVVALFAATLAMVTTTPLSIAHPGPLDQYGCHNDATTYHCHAGPLAGCSFPSQAAALALFAAGARSCPQTIASTTEATGTTGSTGSTGASGSTGSTGTTAATTGATTLVFPQVADGHFIDNSYYRSSLLISSPDGTAVPGCTFQLQGMTTSFDVLGSGSTFAFDIDTRGWLIASTPGTQLFRFGYGTLLCSKAVNAQIVYGIYDASGKKLSEATVAPSDGGTAVQLLADNREGARLALAIANLSANTATYTIACSAPDGTPLTSGTVPVGPGSSVAQFLDEIVTLPAGYYGQVVITGAEKAYAMGLRFTGPLFTTIPTTVRTP